MSFRTMLAGLALAAALLAPAAASAETAFAVTNLNLRAGPGTRFPVATTMGAGSGVEVYGCLPDYSWCDVEFAGIRGWVAAQYLQQGGQVLLPSYAQNVRVPTVTYSVDTYFYDHYRNRSFYRDRDAYRNWDRGSFHGPYVGGGVDGTRGGDWNRDRRHRAAGFRYDDGHQAGQHDNGGDNRQARRNRRERQFENNTESYRTRNQVCVRGVCANR